MCSGYMALLLFVAIAGFMQIASAGEAFLTIPRYEPPCDNHHCTAPSDHGYIAYDAEVRDGVCVCKIVTWEAVGRAVALIEGGIIEKLEKRIAELEHEAVWV